MRRRRLLERRNAHQPGNGQAVGRRGSASRNASASCGSTPAFCASAPVLISTNSSGCAPLLVDLLGQRLAQARPVDRMDGVEQRHRLLGLVGLQRADQMQRDAGMLGHAAAAIWPWPPARGSRRTRAGRRRSPARSPRRRRSSTPPPASPPPDRARHRGRRARSRARTGGETGRTASGERGGEACIGGRCVSPSARCHRITPRRWRTAHAAPCTDSSAAGCDRLSTICPPRDRRCHVRVGPRLLFDV